MTSPARPPGPAARLRQWLRGGGRRGRWRRTLVRRGLAFVLLAGAILLAWSAARPAAPATTPLVVAADDLAAGHLVEARDLRTVALPDSVPVVATDDPAPLVGRRLAVPVAAGAPLTPSQLVARTALEGLPPGTVALHIRASDPAMVALLGPGMTVRLHRADTGEPVATGVSVLAVDPPTDTGPLPVGTDDRGLVVAMEVAAVDRALARLGPDGLAPRFHVVPEARG